MSAPSMPEASSSPGRRKGILALLAFAILFSYGLLRPAVESLFLASAGSKQLPLTWVLLALLSMLLMGVYRRVLTRYPIVVWLRVCVFASSASLGLLTTLADSPWALRALYLWKDLYIVVLIETFWSVAHLLSPLDEAKKSYGFFCASGSLGGIAGNLAAGPIAHSGGTRALLWLGTVFLGLLGAAIAFAFRDVGSAKAAAEGEVDKALRKAPSLLHVFSRSYLHYLLGMTVVVQAVLTLIDFRFNEVIEVQIPEVGRRTAFIAWVYAGIDAAALALQLGAAILLRRMGVVGLFLLTPLLLLAMLSGLPFLPLLAGICGFKLLSKSLDYSVFRAARELLYVPLSDEERTLGKAWIDIVAYRAAKGAAASFLLAFGLFGCAGILYAAIGVLLALWLTLASFVVQRYRALQRLRVGV